MTATRTIQPYVPTDRGPGPVRTLAAATVGNILEWYDWTIYSAMAVFFSPLVFTGGGLGPLLKSLLVFAAGFFMRPLGGLLLGGFADRYGRRAALTVSITLMGAGSAGMALCPTYAGVGLFAPLALLVARMAQGLSLGGEIGVSSTYLAEQAPPRRRGLYTSVYYMGTALGLLLASGVTSTLTATLSRPQLAAYGWRIAFGIGALGALAGYWIRRQAPEPRAFERVAAEDRPRGSALTVARRYPAAAARIFGWTVAATLTFYTFASYFPTYVSLATGLGVATASLANTLALVAFFVLQPVFGQLSDTLGRRPVLLLSTGGVALAAVPMALWLSASFGRVLVIELVMLSLFGLYSAIAPAVMAEQLPTEVRAVGIGAPYNLAVAAFGGTAPYLLTWLHSHGADLAYFWYLAAAGLASALVVLASPETRGRALTQGESR
jgi:MHS family alpha-ketoglutarate permease-like MFS transporter